MLKEWKYIFLGFILLNLPLRACFQSEFSWQDIQKHYIKKYKKSEIQPMDKNFIMLIISSKNKHLLLRLGMLSALWGEFLEQSEMDALWVHSQKYEKTSFSDDLSVYIVGKFIGEKIIKNYQQLEKISRIENSSYLNLSTQYLKKKINNIMSNYKYKSYNQYLKCTLNTLSSDSTLDKVKKLLKKNFVKRYAKAFEFSIASEYALEWLDAYIQEKNKEKKENLEKILMLLPTDVLILSGQRALVCPSENSFSRALASYTLAATKEKNIEPHLDFLINYLISHHKVQAFEPFLD